MHTIGAAGMYMVCTVDHDDALRPYTYVRRFIVQAYSLASATTKTFWRELANMHGVRKT